MDSNTEVARRELHLRAVPTAPDSVHYANSRKQHHDRGNQWVDYTNQIDSKSFNLETQGGSVASYVRVHLNYWTFEWRVQESTGEISWQCRP